MNILRSKDYIAEKLAIKPVGKERLQGFRKYKDFFNKDNYVDCPQNTDETIYALAYALWTKRKWALPSFNYDEYALAYARNNKNEFDLAFKPYWCLKNDKSEWVKLVPKNIYDSAISVLTKNNVTVCSSSQSVEIAPIAAIWDTSITYLGMKYVFYNLSELIDCKSDIFTSNIKNITVLFIKDIVRPNYNKYADQGFFDYFYGIYNYEKAIDGKDISKDIYGNPVQYIKMVWKGGSSKRKCGWYIDNNEKMESANLSDVIEGVDDFNI